MCVTLLMCLHRRHCVRIVARDSTVYTRVTGPEAKHMEISHFVFVGPLATLLLGQLVLTYGMWGVGKQMQGPLTVHLMGGCVAAECCGSQHCHHIPPGVVLEYFVLR